MKHLNRTMAIILFLLSTHVLANTQVTIKNDLTAQKIQQHFDIKLMPENPQSEVASNEGTIKKASLPFQSTVTILADLTKTSWVALAVDFPPNVRASFVCTDWNNKLIDFNSYAKAKSLTVEMFQFGVGSQYPNSLQCIVTDVLN